MNRQNSKKRRSSTRRNTGIKKQKLSQPNQCLLSQNQLTYIKPKTKDVKPFPPNVFQPVFKCSNDESIFSEFNILLEIGKGSYGTVVKATRRGHGDKLWAVKKLKYRTSKSSKTTYQEVSPDVYREQAVSSSRGQQLDEKYIVPLEEVVYGKKECWFIYPCLNMDLRQLITLCKKEDILTPDLIKTIFRQCSLAVYHLHCAGFVHRDIKPSNYLVQYSAECPGRILLADFGLSRDLTLPEIRLRKDGDVITIWYRPLDLLLGNKEYDYLVDIWSLGCIFGELHTTKPVFQGMPNPRVQGALRKFEENQVHTILSICGFPESRFLQDYCHLNYYPDLIREDWRLIPNVLSSHFSSLEPLALDLLENMLQYHPAKRYTSSQVRRHKYFQNCGKFLWPDPETIPVFLAEP